MDPISMMLPPNPISAVQYYTVFAIIWQKQLVHNYWGNRTPLPPKQNYDFIVIGAGSAGAIVACRLAQSGCKDVLLLEPGGVQDALITDHPGMYIVSLLEDGVKFWNYTNTPQIIGQAYKDKVLHELKGHIVGGQSTINSLVYQRGNVKDFDTLAAEGQCVGWAYEDLLTLFKKTESNSDPIISSRYHGRSGPMGVSTCEYPDPILNSLLGVVNGEGVPTRDTNGENQVSAMISQSTIKNGIRSSTSNAFIESGICPALTLVTRAFVTKIIFRYDHDGVPVAYGVQFVKNGETYCAYANKEIILSAGVILSPQLLMLSGIGHSDHLKTLKIPLVKDLPVGDNYCAHPAIGINAILNNQDLVNPPPRLEVQQMYQANVKGTGLLAQNCVALWYGRSSSLPATEQDWPDQMIYAVASKKGMPNGVTVFQYDNKEAMNTYIADTFGKSDTLLLYPALTRPDSVGMIRLKTDNPYDQPLINPNFLKETRDMDRFKALVAYTLGLIENKLTSVATVNLNPVPGCVRCTAPATPDSQCDTYIDCFIKNYGISLSMGAGGNRMGNTKNDDVVCDCRLRVKGVRNLRVADLSIYRHCINTHTNAAEMVVGEKAAQLILEDHRNCAKPHNPHGPHDPHGSHHTYNHNETKSEQ